MAVVTFGTIQSRVQTRLIDVSSAVTGEIPTLVNEGIEFLVSLKNWSAMKSEFAGNTQPAPSIAPGSLSQHVIGTIPGDWKEPNGNPYYQRQDGTVRTIVWAPAGQREYTYRAYAPLDPFSKGAPRLALLSDPVTDDSQSSDPDATTMNIEIYPYSDSLSDWTTSPVGEYRVHVPYWAYPAALSAQSDHNWFTDQGAQFLIDFATYRGFTLDWDEQRAGFWKMEAIGAYNGVDFRTLGGWARRLVNLDAQISFAPGKVLSPRRDVFAERDQWRQ